MTKITSTIRKEKRLVDSTALREAVINAIIHNDYSNGIPPVFEIFSDRFVITSSGGLPQELNENEFFEGISAPRNKELMRVFKDVKLVEQLGSGVQRILIALMLIPIISYIKRRGLAITARLFYPAEK